MSEGAEKTRVLIIGGGPAAMTCAYHLTRTPERRERYAVKVLQMGWRLGGKCASGRNPDPALGRRIEEHGLHILFGFYQNVFSMMTEVYEALGRGEGEPLATWAEAAHPHDTGTVETFYNGVWAPVSATLPRNEAVPGKGLALNDSRVYLGYLIAGAIEVAFGWRALHDINTVLFPPGEPGDPSEGEADWVVKLAMWALRELLEAGFDVSTAIEVRLPRLVAILDRLERAFDAGARRVAETKREWLVLFEGVDFLVALLRGVVTDGVLLPGGYAKIDRHDFADWLVSHGMAESGRDSIGVRFIYDAAFSYENGRADRKRISAGVTVRTLLRMGFTYKGAMYYKLASGMGDAIFGPLYEVLRRRGVDFRFFHKVTALRADAGGNRVDAVEVDVQAQVKGGGEYQPLVTVKGLPAWPSEPLWDQLEGGDALRDQGVNLESYYSPNPRAERRVLLDGRDYDVVVFAAPVATIPFIAKELCDRSSKWREAADRVAAVQTVSFQAWFTRDLRELGWEGPESPLLSLFAQPLNTWSDMSQVLPTEDWPGGVRPRNVSYFTGAQPGPAKPPMPGDDPGFPERMNEEAKRLSLEFLRQNLTTLLPRAVDPGAPPAPDWSLLVDPKGRVGEARFEAQYWRSNAEPHERCTLSLPDTNQYRIAADDTGFENLAVAGDWIDNQFYVAALEGAVMGGLYAARAVTGEDIPIIGELIDQGLGPYRPSARPRTLAPSARPRGPKALDDLPKDRPVRVAVLGGGLGSMAAVWGLLQSPDAARMEITVYQYGWRLGGKGASGRNRERNDRIEEHGLHIWGGMYENAFAMMRRVYELAGRDPAKPLSTWYDRDSRERSAFWPHDLVTLGDYRGKWRFWSVAMFRNTGVPGDGRVLPRPVEYVEMMIEAVIEALVTAKVMNRLEAAPEGLLARALDEVGDRLLGEDDERRERFERQGGGRALRDAHAAVRSLPPDPMLHTEAHHAPVLRAIGDAERAFFHAFQGLFDTDEDLRMLYQLVDLGGAVVTGVLRDHVLRDGFDAVDGEEFAAWAARHGASRETATGPLVRGWHAFFFANLDGDPSRPSLSAASALRTIFRYVFTYRGAFFWKMQAGMGDTVFAPMYEVMKARGVRFRFFHRALEVSCREGADLTDQVQSITVGRQVELAPGRDEYDPLVDVKDVPSWPSEPLWEQLDPSQAKELRERDINLESAWAPWPPREVVTLERGKDFDLVVLGTSVEPVKSLGPTLLERSARLRRSVEGLRTCSTIAMQCWFDRPRVEMGWAEGSTVGTVYAEPHNTWADMDHLLARERWEDAPVRPRCLVYYTGTYPDAGPTPPPDDASFPERNDVRVKALGLAWLDANAGALYPRATLAGTPGLDPARLVAPPELLGQRRFDAQFWRGNVDPSERYVISPPGSASLRLRADESGFGNLFLAGDWLYTGLNAGCVEAAVMGGLQASRAIAGWPAVIPGNDENGWGRGRLPLREGAGANAER